MELLTKKILKVSKIVALSAVVTLMGSLDVLASDAKHKFNLALESGDRDSASGKSMRLWADLIDESSKGRIKVNIFGSS